MVDTQAPPRAAGPKLPMQPLASIVGAYLASHGVPVVQVKAQFGQTDDGSLVVGFEVALDPLAAERAAARSRIVIP